MPAPRRKKGDLTAYALGRYDERCVLTDRFVQVFVESDLDVAGCIDFFFLFHPRQVFGLAIGAAFGGTFVGDQFRYLRRIVILILELLRVEPVSVAVPAHDEIFGRGIGDAAAYLDVDDRAVFALHPRFLHGRRHRRR